MNPNDRLCLQHRGSNSVHKPTIFWCYEEMCVMRKYLIILVWVKREDKIQ